MARAWHIRVLNTVTGERFDDNVNSDLTAEVEHLAQQWELGTKVRTRRPEPGEAVHEYEHGTVTTCQTNLQTKRKHWGAAIR